MVTDPNDVGPPLPPIQALNMLPPITVSPLVNFTEMRNEQRWNAPLRALPSLSAPPIEIINYANSSNNNQ